MGLDSHLIIEEGDDMDLDDEDVALNDMTAGMTDFGEEGDDEEAEE